LNKVVESHVMWIRSWHDGGGSSATTAAVEPGGAERAKTEHSADGFFEAEFQDKRKAAANTSIS
jgi:hypothetical protein